jgi:hypothetical protein
MSTDIGTNQPASAGAGVQDENPSGYEADAGSSDADQGLADQSDGDLLEGAEGEQVPELDEIEHEGLKHQIPKALRPLIDKGLDYTAKTQEVAELRRTTEQQFAEREAQFTQREQASNLLRQGHAAVAALDYQLQQYQGINWQQAIAQDPATAQAAWMQMQTLERQRQEVAGKVQHAEREHVQAAETTAKQRVQQVVAKWTQDEQSAVNEVAKEYSLTPQVLVNVFGNNPMLLTILRDAALHRTAMKKATAPAVNQKPAAQPAARLPQGKGGSVQKPLSDPSLSDAEWNKRRNAELRRSRRR